VDCGTIHWHSQSHQNSLWSIVDKGFSDDHQHNIRWCKVLGLMAAQVGRTFDRCTTKCWCRVYRWCTCWHHLLTEVIMNILQQKFNIQLGPLHHYSSCLDWVWAIPHFISCSSQFTASSSVLEHISCIQSTMAAVIKHVPFILPHCGPVRTR
jgi:hypothetical protein